MVSHENQNGRGMGGAVAILLVSLVHNVHEHVLILDCLKYTGHYCAKAVRPLLRDGRLRRESQLQERCTQSLC